MDRELAPCQKVFATQLLQAHALMLNPMFRTLTILLAVAAITVPAFAFWLSPVEITEFGEFEIQSGEALSALDTAKSAVTKVETHKLINRNNCIVARKGTRFGVLVKLDPFFLPPMTTVMPALIVLHHPPTTGPDGRMRDVESWPMDLTIEPRFAGWHFEEDYELVPGIYTFSIGTPNDGILRRMKFRVVLPGTDCPKELNYYSPYRIE